MIDTLYIVMPAYNEEASIEAAVLEWYEMLSVSGASENSRLVVADFGSTDGTHAKLLRLQQTRCLKLVVLSDSEEVSELGNPTGLRFHGPKVLALYRYALNSGADFIFQTDSDRQTDPADFPKFWEQRHAYSGIIGWRQDREDGWQRRVVARTVRRLLHHYFGVQLPDANTPFRLMSRDLLLRHMQRMPADYELPNLMLTTFFAYYHENIAFLPVRFRARKTGKNSLNFRRICQIGRKAVRDFRGFQRQMRG